MNRTKLLILVLVMGIVALLVLIGYTGWYQTRIFDEQREACEHEFIIHEGEGICFERVEP